jgi:hypothetical protein
MVYFFKPGPGQVKNCLLGVQKLQNGGDIQDGRQRKFLHS